MEKLIILKEKIPDAPNFTWAETLYLPQFNIHAIPSQDVVTNIRKFAKKVQIIREVVDLPMLITSWWRPPKYNVLIGGSDRSWHTTGGACDFRCPSKSADELRTIIKPHLDILELRMEDLPGSNWVHIDNKVTSGNRFFKP